VAVKVEIRAATFEDARELAPRLRPEEVAEVAASHGVPPLEALEESLRQSEEAWVALFDGQVACMWGVVPLYATFLGGRTGSVWLLTSDLVERYPKVFWRGCLFLLPQLFLRWDCLMNAIDVRHEKAIRWARRLGFPLLSPHPFGLEGQPFSLFSVRKEDTPWAQPSRS
jgi:hypothetical protein